MRCYTGRHRFYAGVDLHARSMFTHVLDHQGQTAFEKDLPADPHAFLDAMKPFRDGLVVGAECMFAWYWLADLCEDHSIPFVLGHALYMRMIHGGKSKTDKIDAAKLASMLRGGLFPMVPIPSGSTPGPSARPATCCGEGASSSASGPSSSPTSRTPTPSSTSTPSPRSSPTPPTGPPRSQTASSTRAPSWS